MYNSISLGKIFQFKVPMGIANSPDIFQSKIIQLIEGLDYIQSYLDDILIITKNTYDNHLSKLDKVLQRLHAANLKINIEKARLLQQRSNIWVTILRRPVFTHLLPRWKRYSNLSPLRP